MNVTAKVQKLEKRVDELEDERHKLLYALSCYEQMEWKMHLQVAWKKLKESWFVY